MDGSIWDAMRGKPIPTTRWQRFSDRVRWWAYRRISAIRTWLRWLMDVVEPPSRREPSPMEARMLRWLREPPVVQVGEAGIPATTDAERFLEIAVPGYEWSSPADHPPHP